MTPELPIVRTIYLPISCRRETKANSIAPGLRSAGEYQNPVLVEVRDCGVGLENSDKIFEAFVTTKEHGTGMGLTICRSIVETHNGRIWAASGDGPGATFRFALPLS